MQMPHKFMEYFCFFADLHLSRYNLAFIAQIMDETTIYNMHGWEDNDSRNRIFAWNYRSVTYAGRLTIFVFEKLLLTLNGHSMNLSLIRISFLNSQKRITEQKFLN